MYDLLRSSLRLDKFNLPYLKVIQPDLHRIPVTQSCIRLAGMTCQQLEYTLSMMLAMQLGPQDFDLSPRHFCSSF